VQLYTVAADHLPLQSPGLPPAVEGDHVNTQLSWDLGHALPLWWTHPPSHISFDGLAVTTHWSCPQAPGCLDQRGDNCPETGGLAESGKQRPSAAAPGTRISPLGNCPRHVSGLRREGCLPTMKLSALHQQLVTRFY